MLFISELLCYISVISYVIVQWALKLDTSDLFCSPSMSSYVMLKRNFFVYKLVFLSFYINYTQNLYTMSYKMQNLFPISSQLYALTSWWILKVYRSLKKYIDCPEARWKYVLRAKRGQADTSKPGETLITNTASL